MFKFFRKIKELFKRSEISSVCFIDDDGNMYSVPAEQVNDFIDTAKEIKSKRISQCFFSYKDAKENEDVLYLTGNYDEIYRVRVEDADEFKAWQKEIQSEYENKKKIDFYKE